MNIQEIAVVVLVALFIAYKFLKWFFTKKQIVHILLEEGFGSHIFYRCKPEGSELIHVYRNNSIKKKHFIDTRYTGTKAIKADFTNHPMYWLRKHGKVMLHFIIRGHQFTMNLADGSILDRDKKLAVLKEQGHLKLHKEHPCSDADFIKADYGMNLYYSLVKQSQFAIKKSRLSSTTIQLLITSTVTITYFFFNSPVFGQLLNFLSYAMEFFL